jgi:hypothetical protein
MPASNASASTALGGTEKCCQTPGKSVNRKSIIWTLWSLMALRTSSDVAQLRAMSSSCVAEQLLNDHCNVGQPLRAATRHRHRFRPSCPGRRQRGRSRVIPPGMTTAREQSRPPEEAGSACVRPAHQLQGRLDVPPGFGLLALALLFAGTSLLRGLGNGLVAVCFQQLPRVILDFDFLHSHGVMLLFFGATGTAVRANFGIKGPLATL